MVKVRTVPPGYSDLLESAREQFTSEQAKRKKVFKAVLRNSSVSQLDLLREDCADIVQISVTQWGPYRGEGDSMYYLAIEVEVKLLEVCHG